MTTERPPPIPVPSPERLQANRILRDERFRLLVQGVKEYAIFMLDPDGRVVCWNTGAGLVFGYQEEEVIGQHYSVFFIPDDVAAGEPARELADAAAGSQFEGECRRVRKGGAEFLANVVIAAVRKDGTSELLGFSQITRDVTERNRLEERLRQAQKMEAIGTLSAGVAHDFNNLLTIINGYADVLLGTLHAHDAARAPVEQIGKAGERAAVLTRQLLAFGRRQVLAPQVLNLNARLADIDLLIRGLLGTAVEVVTDLEADLWAVEADPSQVEQVILNLMVNARDAMPAGGRVTIRTANVELGGRSSPEPSEVRPGSYVLLAVTDTGTGMDGLTLGRIFEPFFTTKPPGHGTGLGLSTVYGVVKQSGGHVEVESQPGAGTGFRVFLPSVRGSVRPLQVPAYMSGVPGGRETILLVEDEAGIRALGQFLLREGGYTVLVASDGAEAVTVATRYQGGIDLLITDLVMPGVSGLQLASRLTALRPGLKVLYMSGYSEEAVVGQGDLGPGSPFIGKPFTPKALATKVRELLDW
jgi:PAS domain S-box-containing protein